MTWLLALLVASPFVQAEGSGQQKIDDIMNHLRTGKGFYSKVEKKVHSGQLGGTSDSKGEIYLAKGKMRLELSSPDKTLLVFDGTTAWQEAEFDDGSQKRIIVTKIKGSSLKRDSALLAALLGRQNLLKNFKIAHQNGDQIELKPTDKDSEVVSLRIEIHGDNLKSIAFTDSLDNEVSFVFSDLEEQQVSSRKFRYKPPKGAEVSEV